MQEFTLPRKWIAMGVAVLLVGTGCSDRRSTAFVDVTTEVGLTHEHHKPHVDSKLDHIGPWMSSLGAAAAAADYDGDGWVDLFVTDSQKGSLNLLYRNLGNGTFENVAQATGVAEGNRADGTCVDGLWGDYDNDGDVDLFVVKLGRDILYRNNGDGTFADVTAQAFRNETNEPGSPWGNGNSATWVDYNGDSWLDLYVGNYFPPVDLWNLDDTRMMNNNFSTSRNAGRNFLFRNNGDGTFTEVAVEMGVQDTGWTLDVGHGDINNDGFPDIYNANDFGTDLIFLNQGDGTFRDVSEMSIGTDIRSGMNVDYGDFDNDGWLDIYIANITTKMRTTRDGNMLWHNDAADAEGIPVLMDVAEETGTLDGGWGWGAKFLDYDNDGYLDIVAVNGFVSAGKKDYKDLLMTWDFKGDQADALNWPPMGDRSYAGYQSTRLWRNEGRGRFNEMAEEAGVDDKSDGRGVVAFDYDNDGDLDLYLANQGAAPRFYRNDAAASNHWLGLILKGRPEAGSNRDAVGARVTAVTASGSRIRELDGGNSFCGQSDRRVFFGFGSDALVDTLEIRWPSRRIQVLKDVECDQFLTIEESAELPEVVSLIPAAR